MNISSTSSRLPGLIPGTLRESDAAPTQKPGASSETPAGSGVQVSRPAAPESVVVSETGASAPAFSAADAQAALQGALRALVASPGAAIAAQAPASPSSILGLLEVA